MMQSAVAVVRYQGSVIGKIAALKLVHDSAARIQPRPCSSKLTTDLWQLISDLSQLITDN
jgi:hypothetical protein